MNPNASENPQPSDDRGWRTAALILGGVLVILLGLSAVMFASGWRLQRVDDTMVASVGSGNSASAEKWSPALGPGEGAASRVKRLAHDISSLSIAATNRPDPGKVLAEAKALADSGQYDEALQRHIWYHNHALQYGPSQAGVRLSFALSAWMDLSRKFPKARQALVEIRDRDARQFADRKGDPALFQEVSAINQNLQAEDDTVALFKTILKQDLELARQCYAAAEDVLVRNGEYEICAGFIPDSGARFDSIRQARERTPKTFGGNPQMSAQFQKFSDDRFVAQTRALVEILVATGHKPEAEKICAEAVAILDDRRLAAAVLDAEKKVAKPPP